VKHEAGKRNKIAWRILMGKTEETTPLKRSGCRWEENNGMDLR
jgi:hypothetical protein